MKLRLHTIILAAFLSAFISSPAWANHQDKVASGHGTNDTCSAAPCQTFGTSFTASDGLTVTPYTFNDGGDPATPNSVLDIFEVTGIAAGTTVTFTFATTPSDGQFGAFPCGFTTTPGQAQDAAGTPLTPGASPCTNIPNGNSSSDFLSNPGGPITTWTFNGGPAGVPTPSVWWFYADATGTNLAGESIYLPSSITVTSASTAPEPGTMLLLAAGLVGLVVLRRRPTEA